MPNPTHNISIPNPCHEPWEEMSPREKSRLCHTCQKCVVDFASMSDQAVIDFLSVPKHSRICGRFESRQLKRINYLIRPRKSYTKWLYAAVASGLLTLMPFQNGQAQTTPPLQIESSFSPSNKKASQNIEQGSFIANGTITGRVLTPKSKKPIAGVLVYIPALEIISFTDSAGNYVLEIPHVEDDRVLIRIGNSGFEEIQRSISLTQNEFYLCITDILLPKKLAHRRTRKYRYGIPYHKKLWRKVEKLFQKEPEIQDRFHHIGEIMDRRDRKEHDGSGLIT